jgi:broad specificity phosphatase PhoE
MRLLLLRHGQTASNVLGALDTAVPGAPLTPLGNAQAAAVPAGLANETIDRIYVSTLTRTQETAHPIATALGIGVEVLDGLKEIQAGELEMMSDRRAIGEYVATIFAWAKGDLTIRMPGGESGHQFFDRFDASIAAAASAGGTALVVSHGAAIRTWVAARCASLDGSFASSHQLDNTGLVTIESGHRGVKLDREWRLLSWHSAPIGGASLSDQNALDPTGESTE